MDREEQITEILRSSTEVKFDLSPLEKALNDEASNEVARYGYNESSKTKYAVATFHASADFYFLTIILYGNKRLSIIPFVHYKLTHTTDFIKDLEKKADLIIKNDAGNIYRCQGRGISFRIENYTELKSLLGNGHYTCVLQSILQLS